MQSLSFRPTTEGRTTTRVSAKRYIAASTETVFRAITDIENLPDTNPEIVAIEFLSEIRNGVGSRFRETRRMDGKENLTELEVTEFVVNERVRMVADSHGTVWDSKFTTSPSQEERTELEITMDAKAHKLLPKLLNPWMKGLFRKGLEKHVDSRLLRATMRPSCLT